MFRLVCVAQAAGTALLKSFNPCDLLMMEANTDQQPLPPRYHRELDKCPSSYRQLLSHYSPDLRLVRVLERGATLIKAQHLRACSTELSNRFFLSFSSHTVKFDDCMGNEEVGFESSDPVFGVTADGSVFAKAGGSSLDQPALFKVTARGPHTHVWQTVVQVALTEPPSSTQVSSRAVIHMKVRVTIYFDRFIFYLFLFF